MTLPLFVFLLVTIASLPPLPESGAYDSDTCRSGIPRGSSSQRSTFHTASLTVFPIQLGSLAPFFQESVKWACLAPGSVWFVLLELWDNTLRRVGSIAFTSFKGVVHNDPKLSRVDTPVRSPYTPVLA
jgi:hypothetical protein